MSERINPWKDIEKMRNPDRMFDLTMAGVYFAGTFGNPVPVEEARAIFEKIKKRLLVPINRKGGKK